MGDADVDIILRSIKDPTGVYLLAAFDSQGHQGGGSPLKSYHQVKNLYGSCQNGPGRPKKQLFIIDIFNHVAQAHEHLSEVCANVSALTKVMDKATLLSLIN